MDGEKRNECGILVGKPLAKCPLVRTRRSKDNIHVDFWDISYDVAGAGLYNVMFFFMCVV